MHITKNNEELISRGASWWKNKPVPSDSALYGWQMMRIVEEECVATIGIFRQNGKRLGYQAIGSGPLNNPEWPTVLWWLQDCRQVDPRLPIEPGILMHVHSLGGRDLDAPILLSQPIAKRFLANFRAAARVAFNHPIWLSASLAWQERERRPFDSDLTRAHIWLPDSPQIVVPARAESSSRSLLLLAQVLSRRQEELTSLSPYEFENLVGILLERAGWKVEVTRQTRDGGIDVVSTTNDPNIGHLRAVWQAKRFGRGKKVTLSDVRELAWVAGESGASKGMIVTTTSLTRDAYCFVEQRRYKLGAVTGEELRDWILRTTLGE